MNPAKGIPQRGRKRPVTPGNHSWRDVRSYEQGGEIWGVFRCALCGCVCETPDCVPAWRRRAVWNGVPYSIRGAMPRCSGGQHG